MSIELILNNLRENPKRWLITGVAGFIGSNLLEFLLEHQQFVIGLDDFSTGYRQNLDEIKQIVAPNLWRNFYFMEGDIRDISTCHAACEGVDYILHQAALGSIPRSIHDPVATNSVNIDGFLNMLVAARDAHVQSFTFASSSSTYGDHQATLKIEEHTGKPLSPYAVTKYANELYAQVFAKTYDLFTIGLRYFNVFGPRQNRHGAYAAVIPKWISAMLQREDIYIFGDGSTSRDFCYVDNVIQANILAATAPASAKNQIYNIALNDSTSLNQLFLYLKNALSKHGIDYDKHPMYQDFRAGDMQHSIADINKAINYLDYLPLIHIQVGIEKAMIWYIEHVV